MIISSLWLGCKWNELSEDLEQEGIAFSYKIIKPLGRRIESYGDLRVVRFRKSNGGYDFILAYEKFAALPK
ncbi:MAG: hypothetical protein PHV03_03885 [Desulfitobacteriaceae bacterium]|nr:hypothetical protein [Desulfitobacteriaceae bacterium]MDD4400917.1 hypothetical protein [Desulfitobacteriaceae bacterium]